MPASDDQQRLDALKRFFVLDHTESEDEITRLVRVAAGVYGVRYAVLTLREAEGERVAAAYGFDPGGVPADAVFCARPVGPSIPLTVADASADDRFALNPLVHGPEAARFYAGVPIKSGEGFTLGTLALLDPTAQDLNGEGLAMLVDLAALAEPTLNLQRVREAQAEAERQREATEQVLQATRRDLQTAEQDLEASQQRLQEAQERREALEEQRAALETEREAALDVIEALTAERDAARAERDEMRAERDTARAEQDVLAASAEALLTERDGLAAEWDALAAERDALAAACDVLTAERDALATARDEAVAEREAAATARDEALEAVGKAGLARLPRRYKALASAALAAAERLAADPARLGDALDQLAPAVGATRVVLVVGTEAGPSVHAAWHATDAAPLADPGEVLDAGALDTWADAHGVAHLAALPLPGALVLLDLPHADGVKPAWEPADEPVLQAAFAPLALALRRLTTEADDRAKDRFLTSMSHEVRTALTSILGYAEVLADEAGTGRAAGPDAHGMARALVTSGTRLLNALDALMDVARLEAGGALALRPVDVGAAVEAAVAPFRAQAERRDLAFVAAGTDPGALAWADAAALDRVLAHLLTNAFTYTEQGGVRLRVHADAGAVGVEVQDTGCGIDAEFLPHLFEEVRPEDGERTRAPGSGLGLSITKRLVDLMGGQIQVTSLKGQGSVFRVVLRAAPAGAPAGTPARPLALDAFPVADGPGGDGFATRAVA